MESNQLTWTDTHCHLFAAEFSHDREAMIERAIDADVTQMMLPNIDLDSIAPMMSLVDAYPQVCFPMMGLHPCSVKADYLEVLKVIEMKLFTGAFIGVGETGVDLYWDVTFREQQIDAFRQQIEWAKQLDLPVIIHSRESLDLNIQIISEHQDGKLKGIFHCFGGTLDQAKEIYDLGFKAGIGGVATYKNSNLGEVLPYVPPDLIVLETDAPYLSPVPYRGKRNEASYIPIIARKVSDILGIGLGDLARLTSQNASVVFGKKA